MPKAPSTTSVRHQLFVDFAKQFSIHANQLERTILLNAFNAIPAADRGPFSFDLIFLFIKQFHQPYTKQFEGGWSDNPKDSGGATMRGVTLKTFNRKFESLFDIRLVGINDPQYNVLFERVKQTSYKTDPIIGKDLLFTLLSVPSAMNIFLAAYYSFPDAGPGIFLATHDPYAAFLIVDKTWMSGGYAWQNNVKDGSIYSVATSMGYTGPTPHHSNAAFKSWYKTLNATSNKSADFSRRLIQAYVNHAHGIAQAKPSQKQFLNGWIARFIGSDRDKRQNMMSISARWIETLATIA